MPGGDDTISGCALPTITSALSSGRLSLFPSVATTRTRMRSPCSSPAVESDRPSAFTGSPFTSHSKRKSTMSPSGSEPVGVTVTRSPGYTVSVGWIAMPFIVGDRSITVATSLSGSPSLCPSLAVTTTSMRAPLATSERSRESPRSPVGSPSMRQR
jgi:hypothetical protein